MVWILVASMTAVAVAAVLWPLARRPTTARGGTDVEVYRDQLDEIERDQTFGLIAAKEAEAARLEVSRRLIAAADAAKASAAVAAAPRQHGVVGAVALVAVPLVALSLYLALGSPDLPGQPLASRAARGGEDSIERLFARVEAHLEQNPGDGRGWEVVAPIYMRLGRYDDAVKAREAARRLLGSTAQRESDLGEAVVALENGVVSARAKEAFERALRHDPKEPAARYYLGLAAEQDGRRDEAARIWRELLADSPKDAEWVASVQRALARVDPSAPASGSTRTAPAMTDQDNQAIRGMVDRLAERLRQDGSDVDGWLRLLRSYVVLGEGDKARAALADARRALVNDADKLRRLDEGAKSLGVDG